METTYEKHLTLNRSNLSRYSSHLSLEDIDVSCFNLRCSMLSRAETIAFVDEDGTRKVLKDRYGELWANVESADGGA